MSSKFCCDNSNKDSVIECMKCGEGPSAVYNKDENVIYVINREEEDYDMSIHSCNSKQMVSMRSAMREARKLNSSSPFVRPAIVNL